MDANLYLSLNANKLPLERMAELQKSFEDFENKERLDQIFLNTKLENPIVNAIGACVTTFVVYFILFCLFSLFVGAVFYGIDWLFGTRIIYSRVVGFIHITIFIGIVIFCVIWGAMNFKKTKRDNFKALKQALNGTEQTAQESKES